MTRYSLALAALLAPAAALAGGLDRSGMGIGPIFEAGQYAELSFGMVMPSVEGNLMGALDTGNMAQDYISYGFAYKQDFGPYSIAVIYDQPYGADITYADADPGYPIPVVDASLGSNEIVLVGRWMVNERIGVHAGLRYVTMNGEIDFSNGALVYDFAGSSDLGYLVGASYEIPAIAFRASLTYNSATEHNNEISVNGTPALETGAYSMPQSVNLDLQTGIAENTLLMFSARWADWTETSINTQTPLGVIDYDDDSVTYTLGVARRLTDSFAAVARVSYEAGDGKPASNLSPTDGSTGFTLAGIYTLNNMDITVGLNYTVLGDATTEAIGTEFTDNSAMGIGVKVGYSF